MKKYLLMAIMGLGLLTGCKGGITESNKYRIVQWGLTEEEKLSISLYLSLLSASFLLFHLLAALG